MKMWICDNKTIYYKKVKNDITEKIEPASYDKAICCICYM